MNKKLYWSRALSTQGKPFLVPKAREAKQFLTREQAEAFAGLKDRVVSYNKKFIVVFGL